MTTPILDRRGNAAEPYERGLDPWGMLRRRKGIVLFFLLIGSALGYYATGWVTPRYESSAQILVLRKEAADPVQESRSNRRSEGSISQEMLDTHAVLLRSELIIQRAVQQSGLEKLASLDTSQGAVASIVENLTITSGDPAADKADVLTLRYRCAVAEDCGTILQAIVKSYQEFTGETYQNDAAEMAALMSQAENLLRTELEQKEKAYHQFRQQAPLLSVNRNKNGVQQEQLGRIEAAHTEVRLRLNEAKARLESIEHAINSQPDQLAAMLLMEQVLGSAETRDASPARAMDTELLALLQQEQQLLSDFGPDHPEVREISRKVAATKEFFQQKASSVNSANRARLEDSDLLLAYVKSLRYELAELEKRDRELTEMRDKQSAVAKDAINYQLQDEMYRDDITRTQQLFDTVVRRLQEINLTKDYETITASVISAPSPGEKVWPIAPLMVFVGGLLGLLGGLGTASAFELADKTFHSPAEIRRCLGVPVLAHIPVLSAKKSGKQVSSNIDPIIHSFYQEQSSEAREFDSVRAALLRIHPAMGGRVIAITSPKPGDGKTTVAANLAVSIAKAGDRVLLIDACLRRPALHHLFGIARVPVLPENEEASPAITPSDVPNLSILPTAPSSRYSAERLDVAQFEQWLDELRDQFEFVIVDTPALLEMADASLVAGAVDAVLLVAQITKNGILDTLQARSKLTDFEASLVGLVVNRIPARGRYGYRLEP